MLYSMTTAATAVAGYDMCVPVTMPPPYPVSPHHPVTETSRGSGLCRTTSNGYRSDQAPSPASPASSTTSSSSALSSRSEPPKRLRHWLIDMINSGTIPGLQWENAERTVFRIPWKHAGKNNWREEDCRIFKAWAEHRGKYKPGDKLDAATWKTRLRCALNKLPDIKELKAESNLEGNEPYRVYQLLPEPDKNQDYEIYPRHVWTKESSSGPLPLGVHMTEHYPYHHRPTAADVSMTSSTSLQVTSNGVINSVVTSLCNGNAPLMTDPSSQFSQMKVGDPTPGRYTANELNVAPPPKPHYPDIIVSSQNPHKVSASGMPPPSYDSRQANPPISNLQGIGSPNGSDVSEELMPMDTPPLGNYVPPVSLPQINNVSHLPENLPPPHEMEICIRYRNANVLACHVTELRGCRVHYGNSTLQHMASAAHDLPSHVFGPENLQQVELLDCEAYATSEKQASLTRHVLNNIKRGLIITYRDGCFYAQRLCQSRVFVLGPESNDNNQPEKLDRNKLLKVFDYRKFCKDLQGFSNGTREKAPETEVKASFGQNWSIKNPIEKNLVTLFMVPRAARFLLTKIKEIKCPQYSSLNSIMNSGPDSYDRMADRATAQSMQCVEQLIRMLDDSQASFSEMLDLSVPQQATAPEAPAPEVLPMQNGAFQQNVLRPVPIEEINDVEMGGVGGQ